MCSTYQWDWYPLVSKNPRHPCCCTIRPISSRLDNRRLTQRVFRDSESWSHVRIHRGFDQNGIIRIADGWEGLSSHIVIFAKSALSFIKIVRMTEESDLVHQFLTTCSDRTPPAFLLWISSMMTQCLQVSDPWKESRHACRRSVLKGSVKFFATHIEHFGNWRVYIRLTTRQRRLECESNWLERERLWIGLAGKHTDHTRDLLIEPQTPDYKYAPRKQISVVSGRITESKIARKESDRNGAYFLMVPNFSHSDPENEPDNQCLKPWWAKVAGFSWE